MPIKIPLGISLKRKLKFLFHATLAIVIAFGTFTPAAAYPAAPTDPHLAAYASDPYAAYAQSKDAAVNYLQDRYAQSGNTFYVYKDFASALNHFTQKAKIGSNAINNKDMREDWAENVYDGQSSIRCEVSAAGSTWGGWLFVNGYLPEGETRPQLCFGEVDGTGVDLSGARTLRFAARGEHGGEVAEFFTAGLGYNGEWDFPVAEYPDSSVKQSLGFVELSDNWREYEIDVSAADMSYIGCGFGFVVSGNEGKNADKVFYLDEIRFEGDFADSASNTRLIQSYETNAAANPDHLYIENAAFVYDNALAALAFLSDGYQADAARILDAFVYAAERDRFELGRIRNAYVYGDIAPFPGWASGARLPGWYDANAGEFYEDQYQVGTATGNASYVAMALLQYDRLYGSDTYRALAAALMDRVIAECGDGTPGFTAGFDGWPEEGKEIVYSHKSIEHNIDAYAVFSRLFELTGDVKYQDAAKSANDFIISMYDAEAGYFYTGTTNDGLTPSKDNIVLDAQVWTALALGEDFTPYMDAVDRAAAMRTLDGGYPFHEANTNGGWWPEGTAFTALTYRTLGRTDEAQAALTALEQRQLSTGGFPAATVDNLSTGFYLFTGEPWTYGNTPHIAPAAWHVMAVNGFNPYSFTAQEQPVTTHTITATASDGGTVTGGGEYERGAQASLVALPEANHAFDGWYENGAKIADAPAAYVFSVDADRTLEARFAAENVTGGDNNPEDSGGNSNVDGNNNNGNNASGGGGAGGGGSGASGGGGSGGGGGGSGAGISPTPAKTPTPTATATPARKPAATPAAGQAGKPNPASTEEAPTPKLELPGVTPRPRSFEDVRGRHWAHRYITELAENSIVDGYPAAVDGEFVYLPENDITRAEIAKLLVVALRLPPDDGFDGSRFADWQDIEQWAKPYIGAVINAGIMNGASEDGKLLVNAGKEIVREEMIALAVRALELPADETADASSSISDFDKTSEWARQTVSFALNNGMINADGGEVRPLDNATRAEAAMMLYNMLVYKNGF